MSKVKIDIERVIKLREELNLINKLSFDDIIWMNGDKQLEVSDEKRESWKYIGLSNTDFIVMDYYKLSPKQIDEEAEDI